MLREGCSADACSSQASGLINSTRKSRGGECQADAAGAGAGSSGDVGLSLHVPPVLLDSKGRTKRTDRGLFSKGTNEPMSIGTQSIVLPDLCRDRSATLKQKVGRRIHNARVRAGVSQTRLADAIGTSQSTIYCMENGHEGLRVDRLFAIAKACGVTASSLIDGIG